MPPRKGKRRRDWKLELKGKSKEEPFGRFQSKGTMRENWGRGGGRGVGAESKNGWELGVGGWVEGREGRSVCVCGGGM